MQWLISQKAAPVRQWIMICTLRAAAVTVPVRAAAVMVRDYAASVGAVESMMQVILLHSGGFRAIAPFVRVKGNVLCVKDQRNVLSATEKV